jgi:Papain family cysteine protease
MPGRWSKYRTDVGTVPEEGTPGPTVRIASGGRPRKCDLRSNCSPIDDQTTLGSCSAMSMVGALEFLQRKRRQPSLELSPLYVYYNSRVLANHVAEDSGVRINLAVASVVGQGACEERLWPYDVKKFGERPPETAFTDGDQRGDAAAQFARVSTNDEIMQVLSQGMPVTFASWFSGPEMNTAATSGKMDVFTTKRSSDGGHAMVIVGYDEDQKLWLVRNSWGADFGEKGYLWIPFESMTAYTNSYCFWVLGEFDRSPNLRLEGRNISDTVADARANGPAQTAADLAKLRQDLRKEQQDALDGSKTSLRDRLREQENNLNKNRNRGGNNGNNNDGGNH